ncbi:MAG: hypothetical protein KDA41_08830 [Planctomycetales bacterium]|nr:hypothetical protein [Planctomycetales bacterium]
MCFIHRRRTLSRLLLAAALCMSTAGATRCAAQTGDASPFVTSYAQSPLDEAEELPQGRTNLLDVLLADAHPSYVEPYKVPNAIGDSLSGCMTVTSPFGTITTCPQGGYAFKATSNNNAILQNRVYCSWQYFDRASYVGAVEDPANFVDLQRGVLGFEKLLIRDIYAIGVQLPFHCQLASALNTLADPTATDFEFGNMTVYSKHVLLRKNITTVTAGFALGLPTGDEFSLIAGGPTNVHIENDAWTLTPYMTALFYDPDSPVYFQVFGQFDLPLDDNEVYINGQQVGNMQDLTLFRLDGSVGIWLSRDMAGNGTAAIFELHYTACVDGDENLTSGPVAITYSDNAQLNGTIGLGVLYDNWTLTPAVALPLLAAPNRTYDWEAQLLLERRL